MRTTARSTGHAARSSAAQAPSTSSCSPREPRPSTTLGIRSSTPMAGASPSPRFCCRPPLTCTAARNWSSVQYFSKKSENFVPPPLSLPFTYSSWAHGTGGPVETSFPAFVPPQFEAFVAAGQALGLSFNNDVDDGSNAGVGYSPSTQRSPEETRVTSATAYGESPFHYH